MPRWTRSYAGLLAAATIGAAVFGIIAFVPSLCAPGAACPASLGVAISSGVLVGAIALLLLRSTPVGNEGNGRTYNANPCDICGASLIDSSRLCPHCGHVIERTTESNDTEDVTNV